MNQVRVYARTAKGEEEIRARVYGLPLDSRRILICVDGKSSISKIKEKSLGLTNVAPSLESLASQGFIQIDEAETITNIKNELIAIARQVLGGDAEKIVSKINATAATREGIEAAVHSCQKIVRLMIDQTKAEELKSKCLAILAQL
jgi:hypothetical protein